MSMQGKPRDGRQNYFRAAVFFLKDYFFEFNLLTIPIMASMKNPAAIISNAMPIELKVKVLKMLYIFPVLLSLPRSMQSKPK